ncbi:hypothetical protein PL10110_860025 [Planktothrix agardhii]|nr:hypothetical protein PL10110_860025 [Planktothrix agardhii]
MVFALASPTAFTAMALDRVSFSGVAGISQTDLFESNLHDLDEIRIGLRLDQHPDHFGNYFLCCCHTYGLGNSRHFPSRSITHDDRS